MTALTVLSTEIRLHDGLYSLNDLHKASGGEEKHAPKLYLRNDQTKALIAEIKKGTDSHLSPVKVVRGSKGGTYACKELVYAYAMWISAKFHLAVIRAFDALVTGELQKPEPSPALTYATKEQREPLVKAVRRVVKVAESRGRKLGYDEAHAIINLKLGVENVEHMTPDQVQQALALTGELLEKVVLEGEYIGRDEWQARQETPQRLSGKDLARLREAQQMALAGWNESGAAEWVANRLRVRFNVNHVEEIPPDLLDEVIADMTELRDAMKKVFEIRAEFREWVNREVIGAGTPWTPFIKRKWREKMQQSMPAKPDWMRMSQEVAPPA